MSHKESLVNKLMYEVLYPEAINGRIAELRKQGYVIKDVQYQSNGMFVVSFLYGEDDDYLKEVEEGEKYQESIVKTIVRGISKAITGYVSDDLFVSVTDDYHGDVDRVLCSEFVREKAHGIELVEPVQLLVTSNYTDKERLYTKGVRVHYSGTTNIIYTLRPVVDTYTN